MKTYYIVLERSKERTDHIQNHVNELKLDSVKVSAIDGKYLTQKDTLRECDIEHFLRRWRWPVEGAISAVGCALSHNQAYEKFLETPETSAFIIEDDAVLPTNIKSILNDIAKEIKSDEVILLYYNSLQPVDISKFDSTKLRNVNLGLYFPVDIEQVATTAAYCIGREAAKGVLDSNTTIKVRADEWSWFYLKGAFDSLRLLYPSPVTTKKFKSTIGYSEEKEQLRSRIANFVVKYKLPFVSQYIENRRNLYKRRFDRLNSTRNLFTLVDRKSPLSTKQQN